MVDSSVGIARREAGVQSSVRIIGPGLSPGWQFDICQGIDDLVGDLLFDVRLAGHVVSPFDWVVDNDVLVGVLSVQKCCPTKKGSEKLRYL